MRDVRGGRSIETLLIWCAIVSLSACADEQASAPVIPGGIVVTTSTTGEDVDPDGYEVLVDGVASASVGVNSTITISDVAPGSRSVELAGDAVNCTIVGENPRTVEVGTRTDTPVGFEISCVPTLAGKLLILSDRSGDSDLYEMSTDGSELLNLTDHPSEDVDGAVSPDGLRFAFSSDRDGDLDIYVADASGENVVRLTTTPGADSRPTWSPDGERIAFSSEATNDIMIIDVADARLTNLLEDVWLDLMPAWSPDGGRIAFVSARAGGLQIFLVDVSGGDPVSVTPGEDYAIQPAWSPDATRLAYARREGSGDDWSIRIVQIDELSVATVPTGGSFEVLPAWSPDGQSLLFASFRDFTRDVYEYRYGDGSEHRLTVDPARDEPASGQAWR